MVGAKPFLRWAGSKRKQIHRLREFWNESFYRYVEPFAGSACLFFSLSPDRALLSDTNAELIDAYTVVRDHADRVYRRLLEWPRTPETYYSLRASAPARFQPVDRAARFMYLNRNAFNGIFRTNRDGHFNVPFAANGAGRYPTSEEFVAATALLKNARIVHRDFGRTLSETRAGDLVYLDPPYTVTNRRVFREYGATPFSHADLSRLQRHLKSMSSRGVKFILSYSDSPEGRQLAEGWSRRRWRVRRNIAGFTAARRYAFELLITNATAD